MIPGRARSAQGGVSRAIIAVGVVARQCARVVGVHYDTKQEGKEEVKKKKEQEKRRKNKDILKDIEKKKKEKKRKEKKRKERGKMSV